jgi:hypothetical protein
MKITWKQFIENLEEINGRAICGPTFADFEYDDEELYDRNNDVWFDEESNPEIEITKSMVLIDTNGERQLYDFVKTIPHDISEIIK